MSAVAARNISKCRPQKASNTVSVWSGSGIELKTGPKAVRPPIVISGLPPMSPSAS
jgi:hypothetical protein